MIADELNITQLSPFKTSSATTQRKSEEGWNAKPDCSTWKSLWKPGLGMWWTLNMSVFFPSSSSSTNIMESMRESTADSWVSRGITDHTKYYFFLERTQSVSDVSQLKGLTILSNTGGSVPTSLLYKN